MDGRSDFEDAPATADRGCLDACLLPEKAPLGAGSGGKTGLELTPLLGFWGKELGFLGVETAHMFALS